MNPIELIFLIVSAILMAKNTHERNNKGFFMAFLIALVSTYIPASISTGLNKDLQQHFSWYKDLSEKVSVETEEFQLLTYEALKAAGKATARLTVELSMRPEFQGIEVRRVEDFQDEWFE